MKKLRYIIKGCIFAFCFIIFFSSWSAETVEAVLPQAASQAYHLDLELNQSLQVDADSQIVKVAVGNPEVADVVIVSSTSVLVNAKGAGATNLLIWTADGVRQEYMVTVSPIDSATAQMIQSLIAMPEVQVQKAGKRILLRGKVKNQIERDTAKRIALLYTTAPEDVIDMLEMDNPAQIMIEAQILEISSDDSKKIGLTYSTPTDLTASEGLTTPTMDNDPGTFYIGRDFPHSLSHIDAAVNMLIKNGKARILSRPNITTMSGEEASILIGGKIPVPIKTDGTTTFEWHEYGIKLKIKPVADSSDNITANIHAEVSTLDDSHKVKTSDSEIPAIASREANAVVNVPSGMTMAIGGLMNSEESKVITKVPLLGDIPIIGEFFRHTSTTRDKRELVVLITPRLVNELTTAKMSTDLKKVYDDGRQDKKDMQKVDLNEEDTSKDDLTKENRVDYQMQHQTGDSFLEKYLNRDVLPKTENDKGN